MREIILNEGFSWCTVIIRWPESLVKASRGPRLIKDLVELRAQYSYFSRYSGGLHYRLNGWNELMRL